MIHHPMAAKNEYHLVETNHTFKRLSKAGHATKNPKRIIPWL